MFILFYILHLSIFLCSPSLYLSISLYFSIFSISQSLLILSNVLPYLYFLSLYTILCSLSLLILSLCSSISLSFFLFVLFQVLFFFTVFISLYVHPFSKIILSLCSSFLQVHPFSMFFHISIFVSLCTILCSISLYISFSVYYSMSYCTLSFLLFIYALLRSFDILSFFLLMLFHIVLFSVLIHSFNLPSFFFPLFHPFFLFVYLIL